MQVRVDAGLLDRPALHLTGGGHGGVKLLVMRHLVFRVKIVSGVQFFFLHVHNKFVCVNKTVAGKTLMVIYREILLLNTVAKYLLLPRE